MKLLGICSIDRLIYNVEATSLTKLDTCIIDTPVEIAQPFVSTLNMRQLVKNVEDIIPT